MTLTLSLHAFLNHAGIMNAFLMEFKDWEDRRWRQTREQVQRYRRWLTAQQWNERWQDNSDRRWLACQHLSDLLRSLTRELDRWRTARHCLNCTSPFHPIELSICSAWGACMMPMHIPSSIINCYKLCYNLMLVHTDQSNQYYNFCSADAIWAV